MTHEYFLNFINKTKSIRLIENIFSGREKIDMRKRSEPICSVHLPWKEFTTEVVCLFCVGFYIHPGMSFNVFGLFYTIANLFETFKESYY